MSMAPGRRTYRFRSIARQQNERKRQQDGRKRMDNRELVKQYVDAAELVEETLADLEELNWKKNVARDTVRGSNPEFPYEPRSFSVSGVAITFAEADKLKEQGRVLEERYKAAVAVKEAAEKFICNAPPRIQRIIRWRYIKGLSWDETALKIGGRASAESIRKEMNRFLKKK